MIFLIQFTLLALAVSGMVLRGMRRYSYAVRWTPRENDGLHYEFGTQNYRGRSLGFLLRFRAPDGVRFLVRRETWFDRLAKALRLAVEPQMHDEKFDARFYVECEDEELLDAARGRQDLLKLMTALQARVGAGGSKLVELRCENGKLDLMLERNMSRGAESAEHDALEWMRPLVNAIRGLAPRREPFNRAFAVRLVFVAIFMVGVVASISVSEFFTGRMAEDTALLRFSMPYSLAALGVVLLLTLVFLARAPGRHRVVAACLLVGLPGFLCCGALVTRWLDLSLPQNPPEEIPLRKAWLRSSRDESNFRVAFDSKDERTYNVTPIRLSSDAYRHLRASWGDKEERRATLLWHPGALGLPWVEFSLMEPPGDASTSSNALPATRR